MLPSEDIIYKLMVNPNRKSCAIMSMDKRTIKEFICNSIDKMSDGEFYRVGLVYASIEGGEKDV